MTLKERVDRHDRQIAAIQDIIHQGMRLMLETRRDIAETRKEIRELVKAQKEVLATLKQGSNGHNNRKFDIQ